MTGVPSIEPPRRTNRVADSLDPELFLPDPDRREVKYTILSVDDQVVEPPHLFERYLPAALREDGPQLIGTAEGHEVWQFEGARYTQVGMNAVAGRRPESVKLEPLRFDQMRPGGYDADTRIADMDLGGIWAQMNFPSQITGFCGRVFAAARNREVGLACVRAWNDWIFEEWYTPHPSRIIPCGITYLADPELAVAWGHIPANEIRMMCSENAAKLYRHPLPNVVLPRD